MAVITNYTEGPRRVSPFLIPMLMPNGAAGMIAIDHQIKGPCFSVASACASGSDALLLALMALDILRDRCMEQHMPDEWCSAVYEIGSADAGDRLLTMLFELPEERGAYRDRNIGMMVARLAEKHADLQARILRIAAVSDQCHMKGIATVVRNIQNENFLSRILDIPAKSLKSLSPAIAEALRELCVVHRPMEGSNGMSEIVPHSVQTLRAKLFARASDNSPGAEECGQLLQFIDDMRDDYGEPAEEARHPDISIGQPWPPAAKHAWAASAQLLQRTDR